MKKSYVFCDPKELCPLKETCQRYMPDLDKNDVNYIDPIPYKNGKCTLYVKDDDIIQQLNLTSNA
jgi:hypothetical protein